MKSFSRFTPSFATFSAISAALRREVSAKTRGIVSAGQGVSSEIPLAKQGFLDGEGVICAFVATQWTRSQRCNWWRARWLIDLRSGRRSWTFWAAREVDVLLQ